MLKNVLPASVSLKPFNLIAAILNQANPTLNSMALLVLCLCSNDNSLNKKLNCGTDSQGTENDKKFCLISIVRSLIGKKQVYDYDSVIQAKQVPGVRPILIGKLVKNSRGDYEIVKERI
jgi:hypothetical protein